MAAVMQGFLGAAAHVGKAELAVMEAVLVHELDLYGSNALFTRVAP